MSNNRWNQRPRPCEDNSQPDRHAKKTRDHGDVVRVRDQILPVREGKKAGGSNNFRPISPIFGEAALIVSPKDEFLDYRNNRIAQDSGEQPELPSPPGHIEETLPPGLPPAQ